MAVPAWSVSAEGFQGGATLAVVDASRILTPCKKRAWKAKKAYCKV
jgi:hypothetical protein